VSFTAVIKDSMGWENSAMMYGVASALATILCAAAAIVYVRRTSELTRFINTCCPELWEKVWQDSLAAAIRPGTPPFLRFDNARRLDQIVLRNYGSASYPGDLQFRRPLRDARWSIFVCLLSFVAAIILLGLATKH